MVTAGVYLLIRMSPLLETSSSILTFILWIGGISALFGALGGTLESDIKKIIAYSTTSQLGYMFVACGLSQYNLGLFHLMNHAYFKGLLFLAAGAIIHSLNDEQDLRKMGNLIYYLPISYLSVFIGSLSIMAFPFFTGYYSKELILQLLLVPLNFSHTFLYLLTLIAAFLTAFYSFRSLFFLFFNISNVGSISIHIYESNRLMIIPLIILSIFAIYLGYLTNELLIGNGSQSLSNAILILPIH